MYIYVIKICEQMDKLDTYKEFSCLIYPFFDLFYHLVKFTTIYHFNASSSSSSSRHAASTDLSDPFPPPVSTVDLSR